MIENQVAFCFDFYTIFPKTKKEKKNDAQDKRRKQIEERLC